MGCSLFNKNLKLTKTNEVGKRKGAKRIVIRSKLVDIIFLFIILWIKAKPNIRNPFHASFFISQLTIHINFEYLNAIIF